jgi:hypothetical protein
MDCLFDRAPAFPARRRRFRRSKGETGPALPDDDVLDRGTGQPPGRQSAPPGSRALTRMEPVFSDEELCERRPREACAFLHSVVR